MIDAKIWTRIKQIAAVVIAIWVWVWSVKFSNMAFNFQAKEFAGAGIAAALCVTIIELIFNDQIKDRHTNFTVYALGILAYAYGIFSNVMGIWLAFGHPNINNFDINMQGIFAVLIAVFIEVAPEVLIVFGLMGGFHEDGTGDVIKSILNVRNGASQSKAIPPQPQPQGGFSRPMDQNQRH